MTQGSPPRAVGDEALLRRAVAAVGRAEVADRGALRLDAGLERRDDGRVEAGDAGAREAPGGRRGMDPRREQRLVGVDVADAGDDALVEERGLDRRLAARERARQVGGRPVAQRLGPELAGEPGLGAVLGDAPGAEAARVGVGEVGAVVEQRARAQEARSLSGGAAQPEQVAGHAQVDEQRGAVVELDDQVLAAPAERLDAHALQPRGHRLGRLRIGQAVVEHLDLGERAAAEVREQPPPHRLDLGELGHQPIVSSRSGGRSTGPSTSS